MSFHCPDKYRVRKGEWATDNGMPFGAFFIPVGTLGHAPLRIIAHDGVANNEVTGWERVSVSLPQRYPTWNEMSFIKELFWDDTDTVVQFHPPRQNYVNNHPYYLHLWRQIGVVVPIPDPSYVGFV